MLAIKINVITKVKCLIMTFFGSRVVMKGVIEFQVHLLIVFLNKQKNRLYVYKLYLPINLLNLIEVIYQTRASKNFPSIY